MSLEVLRHLARTDVRVQPLGRLQDTHIVITNVLGQHLVDAVVDGERAAVKGTGHLGNRQVVVAEHAHHVALLLLSPALSIVVAVADGDLGGLTGEVEDAGDGDTTVDGIHLVASVGRHLGMRWSPIAYEVSVFTVGVWGVHEMGFEPMSFRSRS